MSADAPPRRLKVTLGSQVKTLPLRWWDEGLVLRAAINLLAAREGLGKSTCATSWAARETLSGGTVLWIGTEESREHVQVPRLQAADADLDRVIFVDVETDVGTSSLQLPLDLELIKNLITEHKVTMIVLDPCKGIVPAGFSGNDDIAVRQFLEPIAALAAAHDVVILGLVHFGKRESTDTGKLILGSAAWSQVARTVLSIAEDHDTGNCVLTNTKSNYTPTARSVEFRIVSKTITTSTGDQVDFGVVEWIGDTDKDARDLLGEERRTDDDELDTKDYTDDLKQSWLYQYLQAAHKGEHKVRPKDVVSYAADSGHSRRTVFRLFDKLKNAGFAESFEGTEFPRITYWRLGTTESSPGKGGTTGTTGADQAKQGGTTAPLFNPGGTTVETPSDEGKQHREPPVVPCSATAAGETGSTSAATVTDLATRRSTNSPKLTAREWLADHIADLQNAGHTTVKSLAVFEAARAAGFNDANVRLRATEHPDVTVIDRNGGAATWSIVPGQQPPPKRPPVAEWFNDFLDQQTSDHVLPKDVRAAAEAAGFAWMSIRTAACASPRIRSVPARGEAVSERIWLLQEAQDEGTAS